MIAVDTNLLVYAHRDDSEWHDRAVVCIRELAEAASSNLLRLDSDRTMSEEDRGGVS